MHYELSHNLQ